MKTIRQREGIHNYLKHGFKLFLNKLDKNDPAAKAVQQAFNTGKLKTAVTGVDRATGQAVIIPVKVPAKSKPIVKK